MISQGVGVWEEVVYGSGNLAVPLQRWGHRMVRTRDNQAILFGGFGGENSDGKYLDDLWEFDLSNFHWRQLTASGDLPDRRSNYTIHYDSAGDQVVLFGGGALNKLRFNSVFVLELATMAWRRVEADAAEQAPWERTYHSAELHYPYLVVYGGEGVSNIDLDDCWAFNLATSRWSRLEFANPQAGPRQRRFHSTAIVGSHFYVIGGCRDNYELMGDIHRVDLRGLFEDGRTGDFVWEKMVEGSRSLERWGHSSDVFEGRIYVLAGRVSATADTNDVLVFDPATGGVRQLKTKGSPKPRRKHASLMVGNSLLCFGGYNGKYLNDFHFLTIPNQQPANATKANTIVTAKLEDFQGKMKEYERKIDADWSIVIRSQQGASKVLTNKRILLKNEFFRLVHLYSGSEQLQVELPPFCSADMFRFTHLLMVEGDAIFCSGLPLQFYFNLIATLEYFNCSQLVPVVEQYLLTVISSLNCSEMLERAVSAGLSALRFKAAELVLREGLASEECVNLTEKTETSDGLAAKQELRGSCVEWALSEVRELLRFDIEQMQLRLKNPNFFSRTAQQLRRLFSSSPSPREQEQSSDKKSQREAKAGCLSTVMGFLRGWRGGA